MACKAGKGSSFHSYCWGTMGCGITESLIEKKLCCIRKQKILPGHTRPFNKKKQNNQVRTKCKTLPGGPNQTGNLVSVYDKKPDEKIFERLFVILMDRKTQCTVIKPSIWCYVWEPLSLLNVCHLILNMKDWLWTVPSNSPGLATTCAFLKNCDDFEHISNKADSLTCG